MNRREKFLLMFPVVAGTLKSVKDVFNEHNLVFDDSYFDYKLLQAAFGRKNLGIQNFLINKIGCRAGDPNQVEPEDTPLHLAMKLDNECIIKKLLNRGAIVFAKNKNGEIPLLTGFKNKNFVAVRALLTHCKPNCKPEDKDAILQFHIACATNHIPAVEYYLKCGINPNDNLNLDAEEYSDLNPLQLAAEKNHYDMFKKLICHGGDLSMKNAKGLTPLHIIYYNSPAADRASRIQDIFKIGNDTKFINAVDNNRVSHLHLCCMLNDPKMVQVFIDNGANVNSSISSKCSIDPEFTPLHYAVLNGCEKVVDLLLKNGANSNKKNKEGQTPLHLACKLSGYWKSHIIKMLIDNKTNPTIVDKQGNTPLHTEFYYGNFDNKNIFDMLFSKISSKSNITNKEGLSLFHIACSTSNTNQITDFLRSGVNVDSCVSSGIYSGYAALHFAALHNQKDVVKLLLNKKAQINIKTKEFQVTPLHLACELNYTKFCKEDAECSEINFKSFPINLDSTCNHTNQLEIIELLLSNGALIDEKDVLGNIPLIHACMIEKNYCKLKWSYDSKEYLSRLEREGLIREIRNRLNEIIELFLSHKANMVAFSNEQKSILHIICKYNSLKIPANIIKLILAKGTDIDAVDTAGLTALHVAVNVDNHRMARMLLKLKANVNIKCNDSKIPLHISFKNNMREDDIFYALLESGSDVNMPMGEEKRTLLHDAVLRRNYDTVKKLLWYGADINLEDSSGKTCMSSFSSWKDDEDLDHWEEYDFAKVFQILYIHVQKLSALGLAVSKNVRMYLKQFYVRYQAMIDDNVHLKILDNVFCHCKEELQRMKLRQLDNYTSLYNILLKDSHELSKHVKNKKLIAIIKEQDLTKDFPMYSYLLTLQFKRGLVRSDSLKSAKASLNNIIGVNLPDLCLDLIIKYSNNEDIDNLKAAAVLKSSLKRKLRDTRSNQNDSSPELNENELRHKRLRNRL